MSGSTNPFIAQGNLSRLRTSITFGSYPALNIVSSNMGKSFAKLSFESPFTTQTETGTGIVNSPEPYVMANIAVGILRTQALGAAWLAQIQATSVLGQANIIPDTTTFPTITLQNTSITGFDPAAYDGIDPVIRMTIRGIYYPNQNLWDFT
jgi:hypothetical protein